MNEKPDPNTKSKNRAQIITEIIGGIFGVIAVIVAGLMAANKFSNKTESPAEPLQGTSGYIESAGWVPYTDDKGSEITTKIISGHDAEQALELSYNLVYDGWIGISKVIDTEQVFSANEVSFSYRGSGAANTIEIKIIYKPDENEISPVFSQALPGATGNNEWETISVSFNELTCWEDTGCRADEKIDPLKIWKLDIAISNKFGDTTGLGVIEIENINFSE